MTSDGLVGLAIVPPPVPGETVHVTPLPVGSLATCDKTSSVVPGAIVELVERTETETVIAEFVGTIVAVADFEVSVTEVAVSVTVGLAGAVAGAV
jgi:hypothetical protein